MHFTSLHAFRRSLVVIVQLAAFAGMSACRDASTDDANLDGASNVAELNVAPDLPKPEPAIDRKGLLDAVRDAASAHSSGVDDSASQSALDGRRFAIRIPFGCRSFLGGAVEQSFNIARRPDGKSYEIFAAPNLSANEIGIAPNAKDENEENSADEAIEAVEGFWIPRPWMLAGRCPLDKMPTPVIGDEPETTKAAKAKDAENDEAVGQAQGGIAVQVEYRTVGIAQFFTAADSRVSRRMGRSYSKIAAINDKNGFPANGLTLLLEGKLRAWPSGEVILCQGDGRNSPPSCVAGAYIDRVAFENPGDGSIIAEWRN